MSQLSRQLGSLHQTGTQATAPWYFNHGTILVLGVRLAIHNIHGYPSLVSNNQRGETKEEGGKKAKSEREIFKHIETRSKAALTPTEEGMNGHIQTSSRLSNETAVVVGSVLRLQPHAQVPDAACASERGNDLTFRLGRFKGFVL